MQRREFISGLGSAAAWPVVAQAQIQPKRPLIAFLGSASKASGARYYSGLPQGLKERGYVEGRDYLFEDRYADGVFSRLPSLAEDLVRLNPAVIVTSNTAAALAARQVTSSIAIVCSAMTDPINSGLIASEAEPGANVTGVLLRLDGLTGKQLELVRDLIPAAVNIGVLANADNPTNAVQRRDAELAAPKLGMKLVLIEVRAAEQIGPAFTTFFRQRVDFVLVLIDAMFTTLRRQIAAFALVSRLPTVFGQAEYVEDGGLMSYGVNQYESNRRAAYFVDRILKGDKPGDLPVEFPTKLELIINLASMKALGVIAPASILSRADEVIE
jgi:putative tryptophan/tyrosine transport system substrate-binding protein